MLGWHFLNDDKRLGYVDGRRVRVGRTITIKGKPVMCEHGLHASKRLIDALPYARGNTICRVELGGTLKHGHDKSVATKRTVIWWINDEKLLHEFACRCATIALTQANITDQRCWAAIDTKRKWLRGEATDSELAAARAAASAAAYDAARAAAWSAWSDAQSDAWSKLNRILTSMVVAAHKKESRK